jgi:hypothetical protein
VLVVPAAGLASVLDDARLRPYQNDIDIVTGNAVAVPGIASDRKALAVLVRPDGHAAVRARPAALDPVLDYLHDLFGDPGKGSVEFEDPGVQHEPLVQGGPQGPVNAVL